MNQNPAYRTDSAGDELAWSAFRYFAGEMTAAESLQFEEQLATDQSAREALAAAVEMSHAVIAAEAAEPVVMVAARQTHSWGQKFAWVASGAAAAIVLVAVGLNLPLKQWLGSNNEPTVATVSPALVDAWSLVRAEFANQEELPHEGASPLATADELTEEELAALDAKQLALSTEAPSWMTAAVLGIAARDAQPLDAGESLPQEN